MSIPESRVEAILSNILGEDYEVKLGKSRVEDLLIALGSYVANTPQLDEDGLIPIEYIPPEVIERMYAVQDDTARFALTTDEVQNGDFVYVNSTQAMYLVIDDTKLDREAGYKEFAGGIAARAIADKDGNQIDTTYVKKVDEYNAGKTVPSGTSVTIDGTTYTVGMGAEIFNDYLYNYAVGLKSHAEGNGTKAIGIFSHAEGDYTKTTNMGSHAEGRSTVASGEASHAEGVSTTASAQYSHAEGTTTTASGFASHVEGAGSIASGQYSHAEGQGTTASGEASHAEGKDNVANGKCSHAEGDHTKASSINQHVEGTYNKEDSNNKFAHIIGNGTADNARSNAFAIDWNGKIYTNNASTGVDVCTDLQSKIDSNHKLSADLVDDTSTTNKFNVQANWAESSSAAASFIQNKPTLGTASALDVATTGDASTTQVVKGDDTRVLAIPAQQNTVANGGRGYALINGIPFYVSSTAPTGTIADGSIGVGW